MSTRRRVETSVFDKFKLEEGWFSFLALLLAFMTIVWSIQGANWVHEGSRILPQVALVSFFVGFGLSKVRFVPSLLAHSFMLSVGMVFVGLLVSPLVKDDKGSSWTQLLGGTVLRVVRWCETAIAGNAHDDFVVYSVMMAFGLWVLGYTAAWLLFRTHKVWWSLILLGTVLMVDLANNPPNTFGSFTVFLIVGLLLVVRFNAFMDEQRWRSLRLYFQPGLWRGAMMVGSCLVLVVVAAAFATPSTSEIDSFGNVLNTVSQPFNGIKGVWDGVGSGGTDGKDALLQRSKANYSTLDDSFTIGGPLRLSNDPFFKVSGVDPRTPPAYMQVVALDEYDGKGWLNTYQSPPGETKADDTVLRRLSLSANQSLPTSTDQGRSSTKLTVTPLVPYNRPLVLGDLTSLDRSVLVAFHYQKIIINAPLDAFKLKDIPDGSGGKRTVLVDDTTGQAVPPSLLDLVKYLKDGSQLDDLTFPATLTASYSFDNGQGKVVINGRSTPLQAGKDLNITVNGWVYNLPSLEQLQTLGLQPGGSPLLNRLNKITVVSASNNSKQADLDSTVYLSSNGTWIVNLESPLAKGNQAQTRFENTTIGRQVVAEEKKIQDSVKGNKISYTLTNGKPSGLNYEGYEPNYDDLTTSVFNQTPAVGDSYTTYARRYSADLETLRKASTKFPDWVTQRYLQLPGDLPSVFKTQAADLTSGLSNNYDKAMAMVSYLNSLNYTTDPAPVPAGRGELEYFLSDSKSGYCVHFAGSLALMLRTQGIPSRVVNGFIGGEYDSASNAWIVRGSAAHSWVQAYFTGIGWVDFEPTPGNQGISRPADPASVPPAPLVAAPAPDATTPPANDGSGLPNALTRGKNGDRDESGNNITATTDQAATNGLPYWLLAIAALALVGGGLFQARRIYLRRQFALPDPSPLAVYNRMSQQAQRAGLRGRVGMTPNEYSEYLTRQLPTAAPSVEAITWAYVRRRYGPAGSDRYEEERQRKLAAVAQAEQTLLVADKTGHDARPEDLWQAFKAHTDVYKDDKTIGEIWETYQEAVMNYRRDTRRTRWTPAFWRKLRPDRSQS